MSFVVDCGSWLFSVLLPLRARKSENYRYRHSLKSDKIGKEAIKKLRGKELTDTKKDAKRGLRVITLQGVIEKSPILLSQYILQKLMIEWHHN